MIDTTKFFWNKDAQIERATALNALAATKNVQVSRWVNNSRGRQIVTYIVHTGERNQYASKQEGVLFEMSEDAGRGNQVRDEAGMMAAVRDFLNGIVIETPAATDTVYDVSHDLIGDSAPATAADVREMVSDWNTDDWSYRVVEYSDELRVYATRSEDSDTSGTPSRHVHWRDTSDDNEFYIVVGEARVTA